MIGFPNAKINLGLDILRKREDGYHDIESILYPIPLCDILEFRESNSLSFRSSGLNIPGNEEDNLCLKAYHSLKRDFDLPPVEIVLHKVIPMGGGLGGGSSDGAFMLKLLSENFNLQLSQSELEKYASSLGSDCPFFIKNLPALATGRGTELQTVDINLNGYYLLLIFPDIHSSTAEAYSGTSPGIPEIPIQNILDSDVTIWKNELKNDFEKSLFKIYPKLANVKAELYEAGAVYASMTGSGSVMFGIFEKEIEFGTNYSSTLLEL